MKVYATAVLMGSLLLLPSFAGAKDFSVDVKAGTLGLGVEGEYALNSYLGARLGVNYFKYNYDDTTDEINYDLTLNLRTFSALVDVHPFEGSFRLTAGAYYNGNKLDATATSATTYTVGDHEYSSAELGTMTGEIDFRKISPYLGLGWDTSFGKDHGFGFYCDLGALFQGSPDATLTATGTMANDPTFKSDLAIEKAKLQDDLDSFKIYPVISLGMAYRF